MKKSNAVCPILLNHVLREEMQTSNGDNYQSLVYGSQLYLEPSSSDILLSSLQFISPDSRCHSFDQSGNGYANGQGFTVLVPKRLSDALGDNDVIRAVVRATVSNQDGRTPAISQPSQAAQESLIREAYHSGGLDLAATRLFEAHGPGTPLGDTPRGRCDQFGFPGALQC